MPTKRPTSLVSRVLSAGAVLAVAALVVARSGSERASSPLPQPAPERAPLVTTVPPPPQAEALPPSGGEA